ncbi:hypothetical protein AXX12_11945 [Anaerosporomusa subterranea]|uniref:LarA-like N-terminal domain-containing protein n=1 Tax=Anaerosporomusa subterranea TaxID=1794912 RepID=A0A154BPS0_ANASB|nr:lactate racemase domain-containing protein [Anaerosporomusa subterranea]KYZ75899.1 hypothetical protein AXX12_11945 [Anaerosporomusa subterranea]
MLPQFMLVRQKFEDCSIKDISLTVIKELETFKLKEKLPQGAVVGITAGSRGINNIVTILKTAVNYLKEQGFKPCILAAMGSHGEGKTEGQLAVLESLGITEESMGAPILAGSETIEVGKTSNGLSAYINKNVYETQGVIVINRIKPHTALTGEIQSGLIKKCVVGLGGPSGAKQFHSLGVSQLPSSIREIGTVLVNKCPIIGGLGIVENAYERTAVIKAIRADKFIEEEPALFRQALQLMPRLPFEEWDVLVIGEMGKNYSGTGMDTNIIGRFRVQGEPEPEKPFIRRVVVLDLAEASHGNGNGIGLADLTTRKLVNKIDFKATYLNVLTSTFVPRCFIPLTFDTEKESIENSIVSLGRSDPETLRMGIVPNTLYLEYVFLSKAFSEEVKKRDDLEVVEDNIQLEFDTDGNLKNIKFGH